jgi:acetylornithine deacetylase
VRVLPAVSIDPCIQLLADLVAIDSVNPSLVPGAAGEARVAGHIAGHMRALGLDVHMREVAAGRPNVVGVLETGVPGPALMFCGHIDTVGVDGMAAPFVPAVRDGRLFGRGSQDMKGGVAAMLDAARVVRERRPARGRLIVAAVIDEEFASLGADALVREWTADAAIVTEPTDLQIGVGHKGFAWIEIDVAGRAAHGSRPREGRDAIMRAGRVLARLEQLDRELQSRPPHPIMETASLHASTIHGGREWSMYPDACRLQVERRTVVGETDDTVRAEVDALLAALRAEDPAFEAAARLVFARPAYETPSGHALVSGLQRAARARGVEAPTTGMSFWTDAAVLGEAGIPSVLFGPGGAGLHSTEEYVRVDEVVACRDILADFAAELLGSPRA